MTEIREADILYKAREIIQKRLRRPGHALQSPKDVWQYLQLQLSEREAECFAVLFLDNRHRVISFEIMFYGTINGATVYPREIAKRALQLNAAAVILAHNHPSGVAEPSRADEVLTDRIKAALKLFDIRTLDHQIVGGDKMVSFAERGLI